MELKDKEFDAAFRKKVFDTEPQFEEAAWNKMEQKLRRRDSLVLFRNSAIVCLALLAGMIGYYSIAEKEVKMVNEVVQTAPSDKISDERVIHDPIKAGKKIEVTVSKSNQSIGKSLTVDRVLKETSEQHNEVSSVDTIQSTAYVQVPIAPIESAASSTDVQYVATTELPKEIKSKRSLPLSLSINAGPEFNSASSIIGGSPGFSAGLAFGVGLSKNLILQAGLQYSIKDYHASNHAYTFGNERVKNLISDVEATCAVLEIPLSVSYRISETYKRGIYLNGGISSYFMLREDYLFKYTEQSGIYDRSVQKRNENQHYLSVVDLSATYFIKLKNQQLQLGFEPFVKIPLAGVGDGKVNLKSSGISLRLRYDINKKIN